MEKKEKKKRNAPDEGLVDARDEKTASGTNYEFGLFV
jgi:hypothetical protein